MWFNYAVHSTVSLWTGLLSADLAGAAEHWAEESSGSAWSRCSRGILATRRRACRLAMRPVTPARDRTFAFKAVRDQGAALGAEVVRVARSIDANPPRRRVHAAERVVPCPTKRGEDVMSDMRQSDEAPWTSGSRWSG